MIGAVLALLLQVPAKEPKPWRDFELNVGAYVAAMDTRIDVQTPSGIGGIIDFEDLLGLKETVFSLRLGASVALAERHRLHLDLFDLSRKGDEQLKQNIEFEGTTYPIGSDVDSRLTLQMGNLSYGYSFFLDNRFNLAVTLGVHVLHTVAKLDADDLGINELERFYLPIPLPGFRMDFALTPDLWFRQQIDFLWFSVDNYRGLMTDVGMSVEWAIFDHVAIGVGYNAVRMRLRMEDDQFPAVAFRGQFDFEFAGVRLYLNFIF